MWYHHRRYNHYHVVPVLSLLLLVLFAVQPVTAAETDTPCGNGVVGTGVCTDSTDCCSPWGWCANSEAHCNPETCLSGPGCTSHGSTTTTTTAEGGSAATPGKNATTSGMVVDDSIVVKTASMLTSIDPTITDLLKAIQANPANRLLLLLELRYRSIQAWASSAGKALTVALEQADFTSAAYTALRSSAVQALARLCPAVDQTLLSPTAAACVCRTNMSMTTATVLSPVFCAATVNQELLHHLNITVNTTTTNSTKSSTSATKSNRQQQHRQRRHLQQQQDELKLCDSTLYDAWGQVVVDANPVCLADQKCDVISLGNPVSFLALQVDSTIPCISGLKVSSSSTGSSGGSPSFCQVANACQPLQPLEGVTGYQLQQALSILNINFPARFCWQDATTTSSSKKQSASSSSSFVGKYLIPFLEFMGEGDNACFTKVDATLPLLLGSLSITSSSSTSGGNNNSTDTSPFVQSGVQVQAQLFDDIKLQYAVCQELPNDLACSLCAGQSRGNAWLQLGFFLFQRHWSTTWFDSSNNAVCPDGTYVVPSAGTAPATPTAPTPTIPTTAEIAPTPTAPVQTPTIPTAPTPAPITPTPRPTAPIAPTLQPVRPTLRPTRPTTAPVAATVPTAPTATTPATTPTALTAPTPALSAGTTPVQQKVESILEGAKEGMNTNLFRYQTPTMTWLPSTIYQYDGFIQGLRIMYQQGVNNIKFFVGDENDATKGHVYGLVNIAAFLAQAMQETIQYNACDENSWDLVNGRYPLSNSCGQLGQSYQDYHCPAGEEDMACTVDPNMEITAVTNAKWYGAPAPLFCGPKSKYPFTGYWDYNCECNKPWADPPEYCTVYPDQKAGCQNNDAPYGNFNGRTDVEGCCWWGRGVIQTTGPCNFGKLNYYLGKRAADEGRDSRYPDLDFCQNPEVICSSAEHAELKWIAGMFYWIVSVQTYQEPGFEYLTNLYAFVDGGMTDDSFINSVSGIVNRGCAFPPCASGELHSGPERRDNFRKVLTELGLV